MIDDNFRKIAVEIQVDNICRLMENADWEKETKQNIANNLIDKIAELLDAKSVRHFYCSDKTTEHEKIIVEYNHKKK